ncbi:MAG: sensor histidine kinase [Planctomycetia bacterium]|nr:sensor histidine kinase [Planctomycetia bacterium]
MDVWLGLFVLLAAAMAEEPEATFSRIADIRALPMVEAAEAKPVRVRGVVTLVEGDQMPKNSMVVQDDTAGIWVTIKPPFDAAVLSLGDHLEIDGVTDRGGFAPTVLASDIRRIGTKPLPVAQPVDDERFFTGSDTCRRVEATGIVQGFRDEEGYRRLIIARAGRRFIATMPQKLIEASPDELVDATVRVTGVTTSRFNTRGEFLSPRLSLHASEDLLITNPPPSEPFTAPKVSLDSIAQFHPEPLGGHRIRTEGTVTFSLPGEYFYLQEGAVGVRVQTQSQEPLAPGDRVEVAGFLERGRNMAGVIEAVVRRIESGPQPTPVDISPDRIIEIIQRAQRSGLLAKPGNYDGCLIRFPARLVDIEQTRNGGMLTLSSAGQANLTAAIFGDQFTELRQVEPGSDLEVTGIMQVDLADSESEPSRWRNPDIDRLGLLLRSAADVVVVQKPSWWTPPRLALALAAVGAILAGSLAWVWSLRRELAAQAARVAQEVRTRREAAVEFQATLRERNRLAANLHDTLLQTLAGIRFQLDACRVVSRQEGEDPSEHFAVARKMVDHAAQDLRGSVWALRTMPMPGQSFSESIAAVIKQFAKTHDAVIDLRIVGTPVEVPNFVAGNLLLVAQEAIHNAVQHGAPEKVDVTVAFDATAGTVEITISDDGEGFEPGTQVGPAQGHFGIQGMRERIERLGGEFDVESRSGRGTTVRAKVEKRAYDTQLETVP